MAGKTAKNNTNKSTKRKSNSKKKSSPQAPQEQARTWRSRLLGGMLKLSLVCLLSLFVYAIYLDGKVRHVFEGQRWQMPIQIFGKTANLTLGAPLNITQLSRALTEAGYRQVSYLKGEGEFFISTNKIVIQRRAFTVAPHNMPSAQIEVNVENGKIAGLTLNKQPLSKAHLDPFLLDKILPENKEDRTLVSGKQIPKQLIDTLLLIEDKDFYHHFGISPTGILRALVSNIKAGKTVQGGSTLTQQLVKNMFLTRDKTLWRKVNEAIMSLLLEYHYSKAQLLEAYINEVYLGQNYSNGIYGFGLGAKFYFNRDLHELTSEQVATMVGIVKGPSYYDPWRFAERTQQRRNLILQLMLEEGLVSINEYVESVDSPLSIRTNKKLTKEKYPDYLQLVKQELSETLDEANKYSGLNVYTGFTLYSQHALIETLSLKIPHLEKINRGNELQAAMVVTDISTGNITALVGNKVSGYAGFNRALNAKRPIGSLIKPAVYLAALQQPTQFNLASILEDKAITLRSNHGMEWRPKNYSGKYQGQVSLIDGLTYSLNVPTVNLGMQIGLENVETAMQQLGFNEDITLRPSLLLGAINMSPVGVNQFYLPIAGKGLWSKGHVVNRVVDDNEGVIWAFEPKPKRVVSPEVSYLIDYTLTRVAQEGTGKTLTWRLNNAVLGGKTGTTNDQRDSWFVGYDNKHLVTTWVGSDDNTPTKLTGSSGALVLFSEFMKRQGVEDKEFKSPDAISTVRFEVKTGNFVSDKCENTVLLPAISAGLIASEQCLENKPKGIKALGKWLNNLFSE